MFGLLKKLDDSKKSRRRFMPTKILGVTKREPICNFEGKEYFGDYYLAYNETPGILVKFGIPFELDFLCLFKLIKRGNFFILKRKRVEEGKVYPKYRIAGNTLESAKEFMINEILRLTMPNRFEDPLGEVEQALRRAI